MNETNVTQTNINETVDYIKREFMQPLKLTGETLLDEYKVLNGFMKNERIDQQITDQQNRLNQLENALNNLNMNPQPNQGGMNMGLGMNNLNNMNNMMMPNNNMNFMGMNMNNMGGNNNAKDPFADISLNTKGNQGNNNNFNNQQVNDNNPFSFL